MTATKQSGATLHRITALSIEELETGLRSMDGENIDLKAFWDKNVASFRQTILLAIRDTSDSLCACNVPLRWRATLENQLEDLVRYLELANRYMDRRSVNLGRALKSSPPSSVH